MAKVSFIHDMVVNFFLIQAVTIDIMEQNSYDS